MTLNGGPICITAGNIRGNRLLFFLQPGWRVTLHRVVGRGILSPPGTTWGYAQANPPDSI